MGGLGEVEDIRKLKPAVESIKEQSKALVFCFGQSGALSARRGIPPRDRGRPWGPSGYTARSLSALRLSHRGASRVGRVEPSGPRGSSRSSFRSPSCRRAWKGGRGGAGGRHGGPASSHRGLQPPAPAERPSAAPVRRKRGWRRTRRRPFGELPDPAASAGPMADSSPAPSLRAGGPRAPRPSAPSPPPPHSRSGSEAEEAEQSLSLARTKTRSYGSTASVRAPLGAGVIERHVEHRVRAGDTLQGIALKYGVSMEQIKRANKLFTNDCIFLKKTLNIPVISEKPLLFNGLNSVDSPENETVDSFSHEEELVGSGEDVSPPSPQELDVQPMQPEEVSARDFLQRLDLQIKLSTQAAKKLKEESRDEESLYTASLYHS
ncbi:hypothetical protein AB1E18_007827 [Capra hircus]